MYSELFHTLHLTSKNMIWYVWWNLCGFNRSTNKPLEYVELIVTFREGDSKKYVKVQFLMVDFKFFYNCIIKRPTAVKSVVISSKYVNFGIILTFHADIEVLKRYLWEVENTKNAITRSKSSELQQSRAPKKKTHNVWD